MAWISAVFFCLGAADTLLGDRLGLGSAFRKGFAAVVDLLTGTKRAAAVRGLFLGFLVLPVGCLLTGALCGIPLSVLLHNTWPVLAVAVLLLLLFKSGSSAIGPIFNGISLAVRGLTLFGFCISVLQETTGIVLLEGLTPLAEIYPVICSIGAFLAGILPFFAFVKCTGHDTLCGPGRLRSIQYYKTAPLPVRCKISAAGASCV